MQLPYEFGISNTPFKPFDHNEKHTARLKRLMALKSYPLIAKVCKHYIQNFIPTPIENEDEYWLASCYPGNYYVAVRINIYWHEVFNISSAEIDDEIWDVVVFTNREYLSSDKINVLQNKIEGLIFDEEYRYEKGLPSQLAAIIPIESYFDFVADESVYESVRQYNYELSNKGRRVHKGHNYELIRTILKN